MNPYPDSDLTFFLQPKSPGAVPYVQSVHPSSPENIQGYNQTPTPPFVELFEAYGTSDFDAQQLLHPSSSLIQLVNVPITVLTFAAPAPNPPVDQDQDDVMAGFCENMDKKLLSLDSNSQNPGNDGNFAVTNEGEQANENGGAHHAVIDNLVEISEIGEQDSPAANDNELESELNNEMEEDALIENTENGLILEPHRQEISSEKLVVNPFQISRGAEQVSAAPKKTATTVATASESNSLVKITPPVTKRRTTRRSANRGGGSNKINNGGILQSPAISSSVATEGSDSMSSASPPPQRPQPLREHRLSKNVGDSKKKNKKKRNPEIIIPEHVKVLPVPLGEPPLYKCEIHGKTFKTNAHVNYHRYCKKVEEIPFKCKECNKRCMSKCHYKYHLMTHTGERPFACLHRNCGKDFITKAKLDRHVTSHAGKKAFICKECGKGLATAEGLKQHHLIHTGERPFKCSDCEKSFTIKAHLKKHKVIHTGARPFICEKCGKSFGFKCTLLSHLRTHDDDRPLPYRCNRCPKAFPNSKDLRRHRLTHTGERPFKCEICVFTCNRKDNLDRHVRNIHKPPKEKAQELADEAASNPLNSNGENISCSKFDATVV